MLPSPSVSCTQAAHCKNGGFDSFSCLHWSRLQKLHNPPGQTQGESWHNMFQGNISHLLKKRYSPGEGAVIRESSDNPWTKWFHKHRKKWKLIPKALACLDSLVFNKSCDPWVSLSSFSTCLFWWNMLVTVFLGILSHLSGYKAVSWKLYRLTHKQHDHIKLHFPGKTL